MYCKSCGQTIPDNSNVCQFCGAQQGYNNYQQPAGGYQQPGYQQPGYQQPPYQQGGYQQSGYQQPPYQQPYQNPYQAPAGLDIPSGGFNALSFFFPIVGLILYLVWKDTTPNKAKACGKFALIGWLVGFVSIILFYAIFFAIGFSTYYYF